MPISSYKTLDKSVKEMIDRYGEFEGASTPIQDRFASGRVAVGASVDSKEITAIVDSIVNNLRNLIKPWIRDGLDITSSNPWDNKITVSSGSGISFGQIQTLNRTSELIIPLDDYTSIYYLNLADNQLAVETSVPAQKLNIGQVIVPKPGTTSRIRDDKSDDSFDAYIVSAKGVFYDEDDIFDDISKEKIKDVIEEIHFSKLTGDLICTEQINIKNTDGSLLIDSSSVKIFYDNGPTIASKFTKDGTFYYDENGLEIARFTKDDARVGNIVIETDQIRSQDFVSESKGFQITDTGYAEFEDVRVRGRISSSVFEYDKISAVGGKLAVGNASVLNAEVASTDTTITVEDSEFSVNDILRIKDGVDEEYLQVTDSSNAPTYIVTRDLASAYVTDPSWEKGTAVFSTGQTGSGFIILDAVSNYSPFIDINQRNTTTYNDWTTKVRLGNLEGITDADYGQLSGFGLYSDNVYLKGSLFAPNIKTANSGARIELNTSEFIAYDADENEIFKIELDGANVGDVTFGDYDSNTGMKWDQSSGDFQVRGNIFANSPGGHISGLTMSIGTDPNVFVVSGSSLNTTGSGIWLGAGDFWSAPFRVNLLGEMWATNGHFTGEIDANSGTLGELSVDGTITIGTGGDIRSENYVSGSAGFKLDPTEGLEVNTGTIRGSTINEDFNLPARGDLLVENNDPMSLKVTAGFIYHGSTKIEKDTQTILYPRSGSDWIGGSSLIAQNKMSFVYTDNAGNIDFHTQVPTTTDVDGNIAGRLRYGYINSNYYRCIGWNWMGEYYDKILLHFEGTDGDTTTTDSSNYAHTATFEGNAEISNVYSKWGTTSLLCPATNGYITFPSSADWDISDNWTFDFWVKHTDHVGTECYATHYEDASNWWAIYHVHGTGLKFVIQSGAINIVELTGSEIVDTDEHHVAVIRKKIGFLYYWGIYLDGTQVAYVQDNNMDVFSGLLQLGYSADLGYFDGYIAEGRITQYNYFGANPVSGLTDTITVPTSQYATQDTIDAVNILSNYQDGDGFNISEKIGTSQVGTSSTSYVDLKDLETYIWSSGRPLKITCIAPVYKVEGGVYMRVMGNDVDEVVNTYTYHHDGSTGNELQVLPLVMTRTIYNYPTGAHKFNVQWKVTAAGDPALQRGDVDGIRTLQIKEE